VQIGNWPALLLPPLHAFPHPGFVYRTTNGGLDFHDIWPIGPIGSVQKAVSLQLKRGVNILAGFVRETIKALWGPSFGILGRVQRVEECRVRAGAFLFMLAKSFNV
jgi:hypothetical protein